MKNLKGRKWGIRYLGILVFVFVLGAFALIGDSSWAAEDLYISCDGVQLDPQVPYEMKTQSLQLMLNTSEEISTSSEYAIKWTIETAEDQKRAEIKKGSSKNIGLVTAKAPGDVTVTATIDNNATGNTIASVTCVIRVLFSVDTTKDDSKFKYVNQGDEDRSLVLYADDKVDLEPSIGSAEDTQWMSSNSEVFDVGQNTGEVTARAAGRATVTATYTPEGSSDTYTAVLAVYVIPRASETLPSEDKPDPWQKAMDLTLDSGDKFYIDADFSNNVEVVRSKVTWVVKQDDADGHSVVIADSLSLSSDLISLTPESSRSNALRVDGEAGQYDIYLYTTGSYGGEDSATEAYTPTHIRLTIRAAIEDKSEILHIGDSYNFAEAYNMTTEDFLDCFTVSLTANGGSYENYASYDASAAVVTAKAETNSLVARLQVNSGKRDHIKQLLGTEDEIPNSYTITIQVVEGFYLDRSNMTISVGQSIQLNAKITGTYEGTITWASSNSNYVKVDQSGLVTGLRVTTDDVSVTATLYAGDGVYKTAECIVKVEAGVDTFTLSPGDDQEMLVGEHLTVVANIKQTVSVAPIRWVSSNPDIFSVEASADRKSAVITALAGGTADLIAYNTLQEDSEGVRFRVTVRVPIDTISFAQEEYTIGKYKEGYNMNGQVTFSPKNATDTELVWSCSDTSVAKVDEDGYVTFVNPGTTLVRVYPAYNPYNVMAITTLTVLSSPESMTFSEQEFDVNVGDTKTIDVDFKPENSTTDLTFTPTETGYVDISYDDVRQVVSFKGKKPGDVNINVVSANGLISNLKVHVKQPSTAVKLNPEELIILTGETASLKAVLTPSNSTDTLTWKSLDTEIATVDESGLVTGVAMGTAYVQVTASSGPTSIAKVTVRDGVKGVSLENAEETVYIGNTVTLEPVFTPSTAYNKKISWSVSNEEAVSIEPVGESNVDVTGVSEGTALVTGVAEDGGYTVTCLIKVTEDPDLVIPGLDVQIQPEELTILTGESYQLEAVVTPENSTDTLEWKSFSEEIATVDENGVVTGVAMGEALIQVSTSSDKIDTIKVVVRDGLQEFTLDSYEKEVMVEETITITPIFTPETAYNKKVTWTVANNSVASIQPSGESDVTVKGVSVGSTMVTGVAEDGEYTVTCLIIVKAKPVPPTPVPTVKPTTKPTTKPTAAPTPKIATKVAVSPTSKKIKKGKKFTITATVTTSSSNKKVKWSTSKKKICTVSQSGKVTPKKLGTAYIKAKAKDGSGAYAKCKVRVIRPVSKLTLNKYTEELLVGDVLKLKATVKPKNASIKKLKWSSSDTSIATVSSKGQVYGLAEGMVKIHVKTTDGTNKKATCLIQVREPVEATGVTVTNSQLTIAKGKAIQSGIVPEPANATSGIKYFSDNPSVASIDSRGKITTHRVGHATVYGKTTNGRVGYCDVLVVDLNRKSIVMRQYDTEQLSVNQIDTGVTWYAKDINIATVDANGLVTGRRKGTTTIYANVNGVKLGCRVRIKKIK